MRISGMRLFGVTENGRLGQRCLREIDDVVLFYSKTNNSTFNTQYIPVSEGTRKRWKGKKQQAVFKDGIRQATSTNVEAKSPCPDWWEIPIINPNAKERTGYPTQKPLALLERIVKASSNERDIVLDPFCGCATTCIAAENSQRQWIGIDVSHKAYDLVKERLVKEVPSDLFRGEPVFRTDVPTRTDIPYKKAPTQEDRFLLYGKQNGQCAGCFTRFEIQHLETDHIVPTSHGGNHERENLQLLCGHCNRVKGDRPMEYLKAKMKAIA